jgi:hypothetical protein
VQYTPRILIKSAFFAVMNDRWLLLVSAGKDGTREGECRRRRSADPEEAHGAPRETVGRWEALRLIERRLAFCATPSPCGHEGKPGARHELKKPERKRALMIPQELGWVSRPPGRVCAPSISAFPARFLSLSFPSFPSFCSFRLVSLVTPQNESIGVTSRTPRVPR